MKFIVPAIGVVFFICLQQCVEADRRFIPADPEALAKGGHCYTDESNLGAFNLDQVKQVPGEACSQARCTENGDVEILTCRNKIAGASSCTIEGPGDFTQSYPACCPRVTCVGP